LVEKRIDLVMAGLVPAIHAVAQRAILTASVAQPMQAFRWRSARKRRVTAWMAGTSPAMTEIFEFISESPTAFRIGN